MRVTDDDITRAGEAVPPFQIEAYVLMKVRAADAEAILKRALSNGATLAEALRLASRQIYAACRARVQYKAELLYLATLGGPNACFCGQVCDLRVFASVAGDDALSEPDVTMALSRSLAWESPRRKIGMAPIAAWELAQKLKRGARLAACNRQVRESVFLSFRDEDEICVLVDDSTVCLCYSSGGTEVAKFETFARLDLCEAGQLALALEIAFRASDGK